MAACKSLHHIFEKPLPENTTLLESLSAWNQIKPVIKPVPEQSSFTEIFGELHFKENSESSSSSSSSSHHIDLTPQSRQSGIFGSSSSFDSNKDDENKSLSSMDSFSSSSSSCYSSSNRHCRNSESFSSSMNSDSLQLCTEGLGFESSGDVEDSLSNETMNEDNWKHQEDEKVIKTKPQYYFPSSDQNLSGDLFMRRPSRTSGAGAIFPPPISSIGESGKPWVSFKSYRQDGRFVLKEVRIPTQEFLHASREDGRLKLHFVQPKDEILEEDDEEEEEEDDEVSEEEESREQDKEDDENNKVEYI